MERRSTRLRLSPFRRVVRSYESAAVLSPCHAYVQMTSFRSPKSQPSFRGARGTMEATYLVARFGVPYVTSLNPSRLQLAGGSLFVRAYSMSAAISTIHAAAWTDFGIAGSACPLRSPMGLRDAFELATLRRFPTGSGE